MNFVWMKRFSLGSQRSSHGPNSPTLSAASGLMKAELRLGSRAHVDTHLAWAPTAWPLLYFYPPFVSYWDTLAAARCSLRWCSTSTGSILLVSIVSTGTLLTFSKESRFGSTVETFCLPEGRKSGDGGQEEGVQRHKKVQTNSQIHTVYLFRCRQVVYNFYFIYQNIRILPVYRSEN